LQKGLDYNIIRLVIYKDLIYFFLGFLQDSSKTSRDDLLSIFMFFYNSKNLEIESSNNSIISETNKDKYLVNNYLKERIYYKKQIFFIFK
jgi:hypothetical protein